MPTTRKKVIKTVYKDENDSEAEETGDFSDSGSDAKISEQSDSEDERAVSSGEEFVEDEPKVSKAKSKKPIARRKVQYAKKFISKIRNESQERDENVPASFTVKDLTDADKLLPTFLNLSESDSSEDESPRKPTTAAANTTGVSFTSANLDSDDDTKMEYQDVWSNNIPDNSEEVAQKTFKELEIHKAKIEETKASLLNYTAKISNEGAFDVKDLLAQGEEAILDPVSSEKRPKLSKKKKGRNDSDSEMEDWEEVKESKGLPASGLQVVVDFPDAVARKSKKIDIEMMMKRKMNRVKKEYQVYMHKVHVLCWLGHGNYVSAVLNNQDIMSAVLSLVPSKECYPGERVDIKYVEQIVKWFNNKLTIKQDKHENKFKPKAPPLKEIILKEINTKVVSTKKYMVFIFVSMLRALGLQCRVMFNFVTLPIKPPSSELCSLSTKVKEEKKDSKLKTEETKKGPSKKKSTNKTSKENISQLDGIDDSVLDMEVDESYCSDSHIMQVDGSDDVNATSKVSKARLTRTRKVVENAEPDNEDVSPLKRARKAPLSISKSSKDKVAAVQSKTNTGKNSKLSTNSKEIQEHINTVKSKGASSSQKEPVTITNDIASETSPSKPKSRQTRSTKKADNPKNLPEKSKAKEAPTRSNRNTPNIIVTDENNESVSSAFFANDKTAVDKSTNRTRSQTANPKSTKNTTGNKDTAKQRSKSASSTEKSKYFNDSERTPNDKKTKNPPKTKKVDPADQLRVSHRDLKAKIKTTSKNDVTADLIDIIETRMSENKHVTPKPKPAKGKLKKANKDDGDYQPDGEISDEDFKPTKISPKPSTSRKIDRRVISTDDETPARDKSDVWCEIFVEELEQWIAVDVVKGKVHCTNEIYNRATHPVSYVVGWDNNNYLKDLTRRYVPHWNTVTRKQRAEPVWWEQAISPWRGPRTAREKEEDESLDRMQLDAPLPKSIAEYKNHPLYALKRHLLKYEALYPPDAATLGFVRNEPVYARECVYICRSRDTWLKEAMVVKLGEKPYKIVKARPKWDKLSNRCITDKPLEIFGPWQVQDYEPPVAENGVVPRNAYGNVELFKECMLPKGTVHLKLPGLNRVAKKLNIDCAPAMTGFDFNGGWSHPVYDGFVVCKEFEEIITEAWLKDQEDQERREREKTEARVYGNWKKLIRGLMIRERLKLKYGFEEPSTSDNAKKSKGPRFVTKKK